MNIRLCSILPITMCHPSLYHVPSTFLSWCAFIHGFNISSSCVYIGLAASISSCAIIWHMGGALSTFPALTKMWLGRTTMSLLSFSPWSYPSRLASASACPFSRPGRCHILKSYSDSSSTSLATLCDILCGSLQYCRLRWLEYMMILWGDPANKGLQFLSAITMAKSSRL